MSYVLPARAAAAANLSIGPLLYMGPAGGFSLEAASDREAHVAVRYVLFFWLIYIYAGCCAVGGMMPRRYIRLKSAVAEMM